VGRKRVARLMRLASIRGMSRRRSFVVTTRRDARQRPAPDLVKREFVAVGPNRPWVADMTYVPTWAGFIYLAIVLDVWSRRIVGRAIGEQMTTGLVLAALNRAFAQRRPTEAIHHSDQGSQYTSIEFGSRCTKLGVRPSMGTVGDAYDNAMAESFFASLKCELIGRGSFRSKAEARVALFTYIEGWYNPRRRHSALGRTSPINFERSHPHTQSVPTDHAIAAPRERLRTKRSPVHGTGATPTPGSTVAALGRRVNRCDLRIQRRIGDRALARRTHPPLTKSRARNAQRHGASGSR
jgi:putative transposase